MGDLTDFDKKKIVLGNLREARTYAMFAMEAQCRAERYMREFGYWMPSKVFIKSEDCLSYAKKCLNFVISTLSKNE